MGVRECGGGKRNAECRLMIAEWRSGEDPEEVWECVSVRVWAEAEGGRRWEVVGGRWPREPADGPREVAFPREATLPCPTRLTWRAQRGLVTTWATTP